METNKIRKLFLDYFKQLGHEVVQSSALVPGEDQTLLFTNAGMVQFKQVFLGEEKRSYTCATSAQRCVRAGGKHNDLANVGYTTRHHTFFEMLGNFSFGEYFKDEAIEFAWVFLTKILKLPKEKLWVTVYKDDKESEDIWLNKIKVDKSRFSYCGEKDNFWAMGNTGPCGPCTEIFYDHGAEVAGGPPGTPEQEGDRYVEIWNLVFMQYNRTEDKKLHDLPKVAVDTGMGLERIAAVMQNVSSNYDTDVFQSIIKEIHAIAGQKLADIPTKVIADHIRAVVFLIADQVRPSNEGRGYVLRRIIRRAYRYGYQSGFSAAFMYKLVPVVVREMYAAYPQLVELEKSIIAVIKQEESVFAETLQQGLNILDKAIAKLVGKEIPGDTVFLLYDTYGFPVDLTKDMAAEQGYGIDEVGFEQAMSKQRQQSRQAHKFKQNKKDLLPVRGKTKFTGYNHIRDAGVVVQILKNQQAAGQLSSGDSGILILDKTPFYAESGGQIGDRGYIKSKSGEFEVEDTQKQAEVILHIGKMHSGELKLNEQVEASVDKNRVDIVLNHSATHLLHAALRQVLGEHVIQKGSLVAADRLRFDFTHFTPMTQNELVVVEDLVNAKIRENIPANIEEMSLIDAKAAGIMALFDEKYADNVRVMQFANFSRELCGGTHVHATGEIGLFKLISETGIASGVRRIEAVTGQFALSWVRERDSMLLGVANTLKTNVAGVVDKLDKVLFKSKQLEKELKQDKRIDKSVDIEAIIKKSRSISAVNLLCYIVEDGDVTSMRSLLDQLKTKLKKAVIILVSPNKEKTMACIAVTKDIVDQIKATDVMQFLVGKLGGKGGGRPDFAQGILKDSHGLNQVITADIDDWLSGFINKEKE